MREHLPPDFCVNSRVQGYNLAGASAWQQWQWCRVVDPPPIGTYASFMLEAMCRQCSALSPGLFLIFFFLSKDKPSKDNQLLNNYLDKYLKGCLCICTLICKYKWWIMHIWKENSYVRSLVESLIIMQLSRFCCALKFMLHFNVQICFLNPHWKSENF